MLFAQEAASGPQTYSVAFLFTVLVPVVLLVLVAAGIVLLLRHLRFNRERLHAERLKMIEMGYPLEDSAANKQRDKFMHNAFWVSFWMVAAVPAVFSVAATATDRGAETEVLLVIWIGSALTGIAAVVSACVLMIYSRFQSDEIDDAPHRPMKPPKQI